MNTLIIFCAQYLIWIIAAAAAGYLIYTPRRNRMLLLAAISLPLAYAVGKLVGFFWYNARPFVSDGITPLFAHAANNGMPSDHTLLAMTIAAIIFVHNRTLGTMLVLLAAAVGVARVLAGVHHDVDIVAGAAIAVATVFIVQVLYTKWASRFSTHY